MIDALEWQSAHCRDVGSLLAAGILTAVANEVASGGDLAGMLPRGARFGDLYGLRVMSVVHQLAIERVAPLVALHLPTLGGTPPVGEAAMLAWQTAVVEALVAHPDAVAEGLTRAPQTNETGRAALLRAALSSLGDARPVRLMEIGASAGLNLRADHLPGDPSLEVGPLPRVVERVGCDLAPIDVTTQEGRTRLSSYVWVDDVERFARLGAALEVAARVPATVVRQEAADFTEGLTLVDGTTTVLWHSTMWPYLAPGTRRRILAQSARLGAEATESARFAHVSWEWPGAGADDAGTHELVVREWGGGADGRPSRLTAAPHITNADGLIAHRVVGDESVSNRVDQWFGRPRVLARGPSHGPGSVLVPRREFDIDPLAHT